MAFEQKIQKKKKLFGYLNIPKSRTHTIFFYETAIKRDTQMPCFAISPIFELVLSLKLYNIVFLILF